MSHSAVQRTSTNVPTGRLAMWWFLSSEVAIFGGLILVYVLMRLRHPEWEYEAMHTLSSAGAINTMVLLTSSLFVVLGHKAAHEGDGRRAAMWVWLTVGGGLVFLCIKVYEYNHEFHEGLLPTTNLFWSFYYLMTGLHAAHVVAGMTALAVVGWAAGKGRHLHRVEYAGMYWHLVDIVWIFLFPLLYVAS